MSLDRDLRDALQPLAGDPTADAMRVLAALPVPDSRKPVPHRGRRPLPWWLVGSGLLVAVGLGFALGRLGGPGEAPAPPKSEPAPAVTEPPKAPSPPPSGPLAMQDMLMLMAFGEMAIDEPGVGSKELKPGGYEVVVGSRLATRQGPAGVYVWANDARVRLDADSAARVEPTFASLEQGRLWLSTATRPTAYRIDAGLAVVQCEGAELQVERQVQGVRLLAFAGEAFVRTAAGESVRLLAPQQVFVDAARGLGRPQPIPFAGSVTGWMVPMILQQQDERELEERIRTMVEAYLDGRHRDAAMVELRRLGSRPVPKLYSALDRLAADSLLLRRTAALVGDLASFGQAPWLFLLLERDDAEVRAVTFRALVRVTGEAVEDEAFWRTAEPAARDAALQRWRERVR